MPYLSSAKIEQIASRVVNAYWGIGPHGSSTGGRICPEILAQKLLGLKVEYRSLSRNGSILGMTAFEKVGVRIYENNVPGYYYLDGHTILIEASLAEEGANPSRRNFTLMHETCHQIFWMLFPAEYMPPAQYRKVYCYTAAMYGHQSKLVNWEEWRVNTLTAAILMPKELLIDQMHAAGLGEKLRLLNKVFAAKEYKAFAAVAEAMGVSDLSPLSGLTELETLRIPSVSEISDLSPLSGLTALKTLAVNGISYSGVGKITSLEPLANLKNLEVISLNVDSETGVDLTPLAGLTHLRELTFGGAVHMDSLEVFSSMTETEELVLHATNSNYCSASDLSAFSHMAKLQRLSISVDGLTSLTGLESLRELLEIELYSDGSTCTTLQPLAGLESLQSVTISLRGTRSLDISALGELPNLQWVHVGPERAISDKSPIDHIYNVNFFN